MLILDQFQFFYAFTHDACKYIPSHVTDAMHQKLKHFFYSSKDRLNHCMCKGSCYFSQEPNSFLEILLSVEYFKILVSQNSECETDVMKKLTIEILILFSACHSRLRRHVCRVLLQTKRTYNKVNGKSRHGWCLTCHFAH